MFHHAHADRDRAELPPYLVVPGWGGSGPDHWQTLWERDLDATRVDLHNWWTPFRDTWIEALDAALARLARHDERPPVLLAHSLGCIVVASWARTFRRAIRAALLVAPADVDRAPSLQHLRGFGPVPTEALPFPSLVITSDDDVHVSVERAAAFARSWGSELHTIAGGGHLNAASGLGAWEHGLERLAQLLRSTEHPRTRSMAT